MMTAQRMILTIAFVLAIVPPSTARAQTAKQLEQERQANAVKKRQVRQKLVATKSKQQKLLREVKAADAQLRAARGQLSGAKSRLEMTQANLADIRAQHAKTKQELEATQEAFGARLKVLCKRGHGSYLAVVLDAEDFSQFSRRAFIAQRILDHDAALLESIKAKKAELATQQAQLEAEEAQEALESREVANRTAIVEQRTKAVRARKADVDRQRRVLEAQLDQLEKDAQWIGRQLKAIAKGGVVYKGPPQWTGRYQFPIAGGKVTCGYGMRMHPILRRRRMHYGIDIPAHTGTPIQAAEAGLVVLTRRMKGYGKTIIIDHGGGVQTLYAHCSSLIAKKGQTVRRGQMIARVGSTGLSTGPHLHFELRVNGKAVNPLR